MLRLVEDERREGKLGYPKLSIMAMQFPVIEPLVGPITSSMVLMLAGEAGVGKSLWLLECMAHLAAGRLFGYWDCETPRRVLYIDGEMPGAIIQQRLRNLPDTDNLRLMFGRDAPDMSAHDDRQRLMDHAEQFDVVVFDTVSSLISPQGDIGPFQPEYWLQVTPFNDMLANMGKTVIWVDHLNKQGQVFGTNLKHHKVSDMWLMTKDKNEETGFHLESTKGRNAPSKVQSSWYFTAMEGWRQQP